jgi:hypothetical protein
VKVGQPHAPTVLDEIAPGLSAPLSSSRRPAPRSKVQKIRGRLMRRRRRRLRVDVGPGSGSFGMDALARSTNAAISR